MKNKEIKLTNKLKNENIYTKEKWKEVIKMNQKKNIKRITVFLLAFTLLVTGNGANVFAKSNNKTNVSAINASSKIDLSASALVDALFTDSSHTKLIPGLTKGTIDAARVVVNLLLPGSIKTELLNLLQKAEDLLNKRALDITNATAAVDGLFSDSAHLNIKVGLTQVDIDNASLKVDLIDDEILKNTLSTTIQTVQSLFDTQNNENAQISAAQAAVNALFTDSSHTKIIDGLTQAQIDAAKVLVNVLPGSTLKTDLNALITTAQTLFNNATNEQAKEQQAQNAVNALFTDSSHTKIKDSVGQQDINDARALVNNLQNATLKANLNSLVDGAQELLDERNVNQAKEQAALIAVNALFSDNTHLSIKVDLTQLEIDNALALVNDLPNSLLKTTLNALVNTAQILFNNIGNENAQEQAAENAVNGLFTDSSHTKIKDSVTQQDINNAKALVNAVSDTNKKAELNAQIEIAQSLFNEREKQNQAQEAVDALFKDDAHTELKVDVKQSDIDNARQLVNDLKDGSFKSSLISELNKAQHLFDLIQEEKVRAQVDALFTDNTHSKIKDTVKQTDIENVRAAINALKTSDTKTELMNLLNKAQNLLLERDSEKLPKIGDVITVKKGTTTYYYKYVAAKKWWNYKIVTPTTVIDNYYVSTKGKQDVQVSMNYAIVKQKVTKVINSKKVVMKTTTVKYNTKSKVTLKKIVQRNSKNVNVVVSNEVISYYGNGVTKKQYLSGKKKLTTAKYTVRYRTTYASNGKIKTKTKLTYNSQGKYKLLTKVKYNKYGYKKSSKSTSAYYYKQTYSSNGKFVKATKAKYNSKGKLNKAVKTSAFRF